MGVPFYESNLSRKPSTLTLSVKPSFSPLNPAQILPDRQPALTGTWANLLEGTRGPFACRLEEP